MVEPLSLNSKVKLVGVSESVGTLILRFTVFCLFSKQRYCRRINYFKSSFVLTHRILKMSPVVRNAVFGLSHQAKHKPVSQLES